MGKLGKLILLIIVAAIAVVIWHEWPNNKHPSPDTANHQSPPQKSNGSPEPTPARPVDPPDLAISKVEGRVMEGQRVLRVTVENLGGSTATGVEGVCSYRCQSSGVSIENQSFLQGGYLVPKASVVGILPITPCSDHTISFRCLVDPGNRIRESNRNNNQWSGSVTFK
jgi:hypothetical protein